MAINYNKATDKQLLAVYQESTMHQSEVNKEWRKRHKINCPYTVDVEGNIVNKIINAFVARSECDQLILDQVDRINESRRTL